MKKHFARVSILGLATAAVVSTTAVHAELCTIDQVPAATLLVPHFQMDLANCSSPGSGLGVTTLITVRNTRAEPTLAQVNLWSDLDLPVGGFPVYLNGYDTQVINLQDVICNGVVPRTGTQFQPGSLSEPEVTFPGCQNGGLLEVPMFEPLFVAHIQASLVGQPSPADGGFRGRDFGDGIARGYITVDTVEECAAIMPSDPGYFDFHASMDNVLIGDYQIIDSANNFAFGEAAVAVEAASPPQQFAPGDPTFYGRYVGETGIDQREPLPTTFLAPRNDGGAFDAQTQLLVWREGTSGSAPGSCPFQGCVPGFPLNAAEIVQLTADGEPIFPPPPFPGEPSLPPVVPELASQLVLDTFELGIEPAVTDAGTLYMNLQNMEFSRPSSPGQNWVVVMNSSQGRFLTGNDAVALDSACAVGTTVTVTPDGALATNPVPTGPVVFPEIFKDGFE